jgi:acetyl esterase/lipase
MTTRITRRAVVTGALATIPAIRARNAMSQSILDRTPSPADARVAYGDDSLQFADLRVPPGEGPHPAVIAIHGGFWRNRYSLDHLGHLCAALTGEGFATWSLEYRRIGDPGGGWPGTFLDVVSGSQYLLDHAADLGIDPDRVIVLGHSAGGHLASWLASLGNVPAASPIHADPLPLRGAVPLAGVLDLEEGFRQQLSNGAVMEFLGGSPAGMPERYAAASPIALVPASVPQVALHGDDDDIVPVDFSERYVAAATDAGEDATLRALPGVGHFELIDPESAAWPAVVYAVRRLLPHP